MNTESNFDPNGTFVSLNQEAIKMAKNKKKLTWPLIQRIGTLSSSVCKAYYKPELRINVKEAKKLANVLGVNFDSIIRRETMGPWKGAKSKRSQRIAKTAQMTTQNVPQPTMPNKKNNTDLDSALELISESVELVREAMQNELQSKSNSYRELVGMFSQTALTHQEAKRVLGNIISKANKYDLFKSAFNES